MNTPKARKKSTPEELAEGLVYPVILNPEEKKAAARQLKITRAKVQAETTAEDRLLADLMQLKFQLEDYLSSDEFNPKMKFSYFLKEYVQLLNKKRKTFAHEIDIAETELSQLINNHRRPSDNILIRLEIHSNKTIPAINWYKLLERENEHKISTNQSLRKQEAKFVSNKLTVEIG